MILSRNLDHLLKALLEALLKALLEAYLEALLKAYLKALLKAQLEAQLEALLDGQGWVKLECLEIQGVWGATCNLAVSRLVSDVVSDGKLVLTERPCAGHVNQKSAAQWC